MGILWSAEISVLPSSFSRSIKHIASEYSRIQPIIKNGEIGTLRARPDFEEQSLPETSKNITRQSGEALRG